MDYIRSILDYLKSTIDGIKSTMSTIKDILSTIGDIIGTVVDLLGFIGFKVFILLLSTAFIMWILNLVSPINRKINYFLSVCVVLWIAITAKMPIQVVILKYVLIISLPFIITYSINFLMKNCAILYKKWLLYKNKFSFSLFKKNYINLKNEDNIAILLTTDLPTIDELKQAKNFINDAGYKFSLFESEKISLVDNKNKIIFSNDLKISQFEKSILSKNIKLLWFWSQSYKINEVMQKLNKIKKIKQNKEIIGGGDNSFILNFLQDKWNWHIIYGKNFKDFLLLKGNMVDLNNILTKNLFKINLINDFSLENNYFIKSKMVGSDLTVLSSSIGSNNFLNFKNKILFLSCNFRNHKIFYRELFQLINFIVDNNYTPKAIIIHNETNKNIYNTSDIINSCNNYFKENGISIPIFKIEDVDFIKLNRKYLIEYKNNEIVLKLID